MSQTPYERSEELLAQVGWVRSLALQVARDPHGADDLVQDTFLVALSGTSERPRSVRSWLAAVVRNLGRTSRRSDARRARRELGVEYPAESPSTLELVERAATQRQLVGALLELDEPWRSTLLQRFFEELPARDIAARAGIPESTVATRTAEGLRRLRVRLARAGDGERGWLHSIVPLLRWPRRSRLPAALTGAVAVSTLTKLITGAGVLAAAFLVARVWSADSVVPGAGAAEREPSADAPKVLAGAEGVDATRVEEASGRAAATPAAGEPAAASTGTLIRGSVIDMRGQPVAGVEVCRFGTSPPVDAHHASLPAIPTICVESDADGRFELEAQPPISLRVRSELYTTVFEGNVYPSMPDAEPVVVVARRIPLAGVVLDEEGAGVPEALVELVPAGLSLRRPGDPLAIATRVTTRVRADATGAFALPDAPDLERADLYVVASGFLPATVPVPEGGDAGMRIVLSRAPTSPYAIVGRVVLEDESPAAGAWVSAGTMSARTDEGGVFVLDLEPSFGWLKTDEPLVLRAVREGLLPASLPLPSVEDAEEQGWPPDIVLRLGGAPLAIRGRVVDASGTPVSGLAVQALDVTEFGLIETRAGWGQLKTLEDIAGLEESVTDHEGTFEVTGLLDSSYRLQLLERPSLVRVVSESIRAGTSDVELVFERAAAGRIAGRIVDRDGAAIAGVRISVSRKRRVRLEIGVEDTTDAQGRFALEGVTTEPEYLRLQGEPIVPDIFRELPPGADVAALELVAERRSYLQVEWKDWVGRADELRVVARDGTPLPIVYVEGGSLSPVAAIRVVEGPTSAHAVSSSATQAVLFLRGEEVTRFPLDLVPGEVELLRL